jgi:hypothetical protein
MKAILIANGDDRVAELLAYLFTREAWTVTTCVERAWRQREWRRVG